MNRKLGFRYRARLLDADGTLISEDESDNLLPIEGLNHVLDTEWGGGAQISTWYIGLFSGDYTPSSGDTMATFPSAATEFTNYTSATRIAFVEGEPSTGTIDNGASPAQFVITGLGGAATLYGAFISSVATKNATTGVLSSAVRFASPKVVSNGQTLSLVAGIVTLSI